MTLFIWGGQHIIGVYRRLFAELLLLLFLFDFAVFIYLGLFLCLKCSHCFLIVGISEQTGVSLVCALPSLLSFRLCCCLFVCWLVCLFVCLFVAVVGLFVCWFCFCLLLSVFQLLCFIPALFEFPLL